MDVFEARAAILALRLMARRPDMYRARDMTQTLRTAADLLTEAIEAQERQSSDV